jgi:hypothetical protein
MYPGNPDYLCISDRLLNRQVRTGRILQNSQIQNVFKIHPLPSDHFLFTAQQLSLSGYCCTNTSPFTNKLQLNNKYYNEQK